MGKRVQAGYGDRQARNEDNKPYVKDHSQLERHEHTDAKAPEQPEQGDGNGFLVPKEKLRVIERLSPFSVCPFLERIGKHISTKIEQPKIEYPDHGKSPGRSNPAK